MSWWARLKHRRRIRAAIAGYSYARLCSTVLVSGAHELQTSNVIISRKLLADGNDQLAHLIGQIHYRQALDSARARMDIGPDRQMARTVTFE